MPKRDSCLGQTVEDNWVTLTWVSGLVQIYRDDDECNLYIERVNGSRSRRPQWHVVTRAGKSWKQVKGNYPTAVSGPYPELDAAKVALLILRENPAFMEDDDV